MKKVKHVKTNFYLFEFSEGPKIIESGLSENIARKKVIKWKRKYGNPLSYPHKFKVLKLRSR